MKIKIIERCHELDLEEDINEFLSIGYTIYNMQYQVAMTYSQELEYSFSCMISYNSSKKEESEK